mgnify:CR=1 FL=1
MVTGASRGIGRGISIALAKSGYDLVITGRTVVEGTAVNPATGRMLSGSLATTAAQASGHGAAVAIIEADILDLDDVEPSFKRCLTACNDHIDLLINNAVYVGPGNDVRFADTHPDDIVRRSNGNLVAPLLLTHAFLQHALSNPRHPETGWRATTRPAARWRAGARDPRGGAGADRQAARDAGPRPRSRRRNSWRWPRPPCAAQSSPGAMATYCSRTG